MKNIRITHLIEIKKIVDKINNRILEKTGESPVYFCCNGNLIVIEICREELWNSWEEKSIKGLENKLIERINEFVNDVSQFHLEKK